MADQDDVWPEGNLARAIAHLDTVPAGTSALYFSRVIRWQEEGNHREPGHGMPRDASFPNELIGNVARGNMIVPNDAAAAVFAAVSTRTGSVSSHAEVAGELATCRIGFVALICAGPN